MRDVATIVGCSVSAVSQALRGSERISASMTSRIREVADEIGYRPRPGFAALGRKGGTKAGVREGCVPVAAIAHEAGRFRGRRDEFSAVESQLEAKGYQLTFLTKSDLGRAPKRLLRSRGVAAVILLDSFMMGFDWTTELAEVCVVVLGGTGGNLPFATVRGDNFAAGREAVRRVWDAGYRKIGLAPLSHRPRIPDDRERLGGALCGHLEAAGELPAIPPCLAPIGDHDGFIRWFNKWRPEVVVGFNTIIHGALRRVLRVPPKECGFAGLTLNTSGIPRSGMVADPAATAHAVADLIDHQFRHGNRGPQVHPPHVITPLRWQDSDSLPPLTP